MLVGKWLNKRLRKTLLVIHWTQLYIGHLHQLCTMLRIRHPPQYPAACSFLIFVISVRLLVLSNFMTTCIKLEEHGSNITTVRVRLESFGWWWYRGGHLGGTVVVTWAQCLWQSHTHHFILTGKKGSRSCTKTASNRKTWRRRREKFNSHILNDSRYGEIAISNWAPSKDTPATKQGATMALAALQVLFLAALRLAE